MSLADRPLTTGRYGPAMWSRFARELERAAAAEPDPSIAKAISKVGEMALRSLNEPEEEER